MVLHRMLLPTVLAWAPACAPSPESNPTEHAEPTAVATSGCTPERMQAAADRALASAHAAGAVVVLGLPDARELAIAQIDGRAQVPVPPASTLKPFLAAAALEHGLVEPDESVECHGSWAHDGVEFTCFAEHGPLDVELALAASCNTYFYELASRVGPNRFAARLDHVGLNELAARVREVGDGREREYIARAIGHGSARVTPPALAHAYAALLREGRPEHEPVWAGLRAAVGERGTGTAAGIEGLSVAGKTGTAEALERDAASHRHAWFVGYAPAESPELLVLAYVEGEGTGGSLAAPVAGRVFESWSEDCAD